MRRWEYSPLVPDARQRALLDAPEFEAISSEVVRTMRVLCLHSDRCDEAAGYKRIVCCVSIDRELFDLFFNSWNGYRAQYFRAADGGLALNAQFLNTVAPALAAAGAGTNLDAAFMTASLQVASAKVWLAEVGKGFCSLCAGEWRTASDEAAEILNDRWECSTIPDAKNGRKAPFLTMLRVMGGFIDSAFNEYVTTRKRNRAQQIHESGWS
jgi:hypothetical protein